jgi:probable rRNA maturation factor
MLEVEIVRADLAPGCPPEPDVARLCALAAARLGVDGGHLAIEFVGAGRSAELNARHRGREGPTDVLSFPIDGRDELGPDAPPRELGDIVICPAHTSDLREAIVHGVLHLLGMDHERDDGEMLTLQREVLAADEDEHGAGGRGDREGYGDADTPAA